MSLQKEFILTLGVLLSSYLPATAQTRVTRVNPMPERTAPLMTLMAAAPAHFPLAGSLPIRPLEERSARFNILPGVSYTQDHSLERLSPVEVLKTPFVRQARVMFVQLWGGRLQLSGFQSTRYMGGPSGSRWGTQCHLGGRVLHTDRIYGISLAFSLGRDADTGHRVEGCGRLAWIWSAGHGGCH